MNSLDALDVWLSKNPVQINAGVVTAIQGSVVLVKPRGAGIPLRCILALGVNANPGDTALVVRDPVGHGWVIIATYSTQRVGSPNTKNAVQAASVGAVRPGNVQSYGGSFGISSNQTNTAYKTLFSMTVYTKSDTVWIWANFGWAYSAVVAQANLIFMNILIDGVSYSVNNEIDSPRTGSVTTSGGKIGCCRPFKGISAGKHVIEFQFRLNTAANTATYNIIPADIGVADF